MDVVQMRVKLGLMPIHKGAGGEIIGGLHVGSSSLYVGPIWVVAHNPHSPCDHFMFAYKEL